MIDIASLSLSEILDEIDNQSSNFEDITQYPIKMEGYALIKKCESFFLKYMKFKKEEI